jgi:hypothetical protein
MREKKNRESRKRAEEGEGKGEGIKGYSIAKTQDAVPHVTGEKDRRVR